MTDRTPKRRSREPLQDLRAYVANPRKFGGALAERNAIVAEIDRLIALRRYRVEEGRV